MRLKVFLTVIILSVLPGLHAQHYHLTLEKSIELAMARSYEMQRLLQNLEIASNDLTATVAQLRTRIDLTANALPKFDKYVREWSDSEGTTFFNEKYLNFIGGIAITQPLPTDGSVSVTTGLSVSNDYNNDMQSNRFYTRLELRQPLNSLWGYNSIKSSLKTARLNYELSTKTFKREELTLVYRVSSAYYDLLRSQTTKEISLLDLERQAEAHEISLKKYEAGLIMEVDMLRMEVDLAQAQNEYDQALVNEKAAALRFKEILGVELDAQISLENELNYIPVYVDPDLAVEMALTNRIEMRQDEIDIELRKLELKQVKADGQVKADLNAYFERSGVNRESLDLAFGTTIQHTFRDYRKRPNDYGVSLGIRVPILDWGRNKARVRSAAIKLDRQLTMQHETERSIEREVRNMVDDLTGSLKRLQILERSVEVAEKTFEITMMQYEDGVIDSQHFAQERARLNTSYMTRLSAYIQYQLLLSELQRATFYDFVTDTPIIQ